MEKHLILCFLNTLEPKLCYPKVNKYFQDIMQSGWERSGGKVLKNLWCYTVGGGGISLTKGYCCLISFRNALLWTIYIINSVDKTKIDCIRKILLSMIKARNYLKALTL